MATITSETSHVYLGLSIFTKSDDLCMNIFLVKKLIPEITFFFGI